ncbi:MAG: hypothetical protein IJR86_05400 [Bacteroidaceae bacterium]|nr:hypothetical protein [Bacteroidaceae bacterium]
MGNLRLMVLLLCVNLSVLCNSQTVLDSNIEGLPYKIPTPNASTFGQYGLVPVSPYTGKADINIPIYSMDERNVKLDIKLTYDTSGILVNQLPGWTGHGWTLMAGGSITRKCVGKPDEWSSNIESGLSQSESFSYLKNAKKIAEKLSSTVVASNLLNYMCADMFYFNFMGKTGYFWFGNDGEWKVQSESNICVEFDVDDDSNYIYPFIEYQPYALSYSNAMSKTIKGFTLIDDDGVRYTFGGDVSSIEYSTDLMKTYMSNPEHEWEASTWMLTSVCDRYGNTLYKLEYERGKFITQLCHADYTEIYDVILCDLGPDSEGTVSKSVTNLSATLNSPIYLKQITSLSNDRVCFERSSAFPDTIASHILYPSMYDSDGTPNGVLGYMTIKSGIKYQDKHFFYLQDESLSCYQANSEVSKVLDPLSSMDLDLLRSISISKSGVVWCLNYDKRNRIHLSNVLVKTLPYRLMEYKMSYWGYERITADYLTKQYDYWGYYNGVNYDVDSTQTDFILEPVGMNGENCIGGPFLPNEKMSKMGMLTRLTYPTGGYMTVQYEQNTCSKYVNDNRRGCTMMSSDVLVGGLRVSQLDCHDNGGQVLLSKKYEYKKSDGRSSGVLTYYPRLSCRWKTEIHRVGNAFVKDIQVGMCSSVIPLSNSFAPHITYSEVKEVEKDNSCSVKKFITPADVPDDGIVCSSNDTIYSTPYDRYSERGYYYGKLLSEIKYDKNGDAVSETYCEYTSDEDRKNEGNYTLATNYRSHITEPGDGMLFGNVFRIYHTKVSLSKCTTKIRHGDRWVTQVHDFNYDDYITDYVSSGKKVYKANVRTLVGESNKCEGNIVDVKYTYPYLEKGTNNKLMTGYYFPKLSTKIYYNNVFVKGQKTSYGVCKGKFVPQYEISLGKTEYVLDTIVKYKSYSKSFRPYEVIDGKGIHHFYYWDANDRIIAVVDNGNSSMRLNPEAKKANEVFADSQEAFGTKPLNIKACTYTKGGNIRSIVEGNKQSTYFEYAPCGRLYKEIDEWNNVVNKYTYKFANQKFMFGDEFLSCPDVKMSLPVDEKYYLVTGDYYNQ